MASSVNAFATSLRKKTCILGVWRMYIEAVRSSDIELGNATGEEADRIYAGYQGLTLTKTTILTTPKMCEAYTRLQSALFVAACYIVGDSIIMQATYDLALVQALPETFLLAEEVYSRVIESQRKGFSDTTHVQAAMEKFKAACPRLFAS